VTCVAEPRFVQMQGGANSFYFNVFPLILDHFDDIDEKLITKASSMTGFPASIKGLSYLICSSSQFMFFRKRISMNVLVD
jgi:hypothetical protein